MDHTDYGPIFSQDKYHTYTDIGRQIDNEFAQALHPIFTRWLDLGYSPREVGYLATRAAMDVECQEILLRNAKHHDEEQAAKKAKKEAENGKQGQ